MVVQVGMKRPIFGPVVSANSTVGTPDLRWLLILLGVVLPHRPGEIFTAIFSQFFLSI